MNEKVEQAFKFLCEQYVKDLNRYENKEIDKDYFYNPKYECGFKVNGENVYFADILKALDDTEELIAEQHRLFDLAKEQENELKELKEFVKVLCKMKIVDTNHKIYGINEDDIVLIEKVVEKYGK